MSAGFARRVCELCDEMKWSRYFSDLEGYEYICKDCMKEALREMGHDFRFKTAPRAGRLEHYELTEKKYRQIFDQQDGKCGICRREFWRTTMCIDHDHHTGRVRGLLCSRCNTGLGQFKDSAMLLASAIVYLKDDSGGDIT